MGKISLLVCHYLKHGPGIAFLTAITANILIEYLEILKAVQVLLGCLAFVISIVYALWKWRSDWFRDKRDRIKKKDFFNRIYLTGNN